MDGDCVICFDPFIEPKGLPCLHTFCRGCLQMFIDRHSDSTSFNCPTCKKKTLPFDSEKPKSEWAKGFPTNNYVRLVSSPCSIHLNKPMTINCNTCKKIICSKCCLDTHENCVKILTEMDVEKIKKSLILHKDKLRQKLEFLKECLLNIPEKKTIESSVGKISKQLISFINKQKKTELQSLETSYSNESAKLEEMKNNIVQCMKNLNENIEDLNNIFDGESTDDKLNEIVFYKPKHVLINTISDLIQPGQKTEDFIINPNFLKLKDDILTQDMVEKLNLTPPYLGTDEVLTEEVRATEVIDCVDEIPSFTLTNTVTISGHRIPTINDMVMLNDQCFLLTDACFKTIWKFSTSGEYLQHIIFKKEPFGLCLLENNCVAVSQPSKKIILILDCDDLTVKDSFSFEKSYYGLGSNDRTRIFAMFRDSYICVDIISKSNPESSYEISGGIKLPFVSSIFRRLRILPSGDILIFIFGHPWILCCINQNGQVVFLYKGIGDNSLEYISDIAVSTHFIYVADKTRNVIHRIQHKGDFVDIALTSCEIMAQPKKIFVNNEGVLSMFYMNTEDYKIQLFSN